MAPNASNARAARRRIPNPLDYVNGVALGKQLRSNPGDRNYGTTVPDSNRPPIVIPGGRKRRYPLSRVDRNT